MGSFESGAVIMFGNGLQDYSAGSGLADYMGCGCASPPADSTAGGFDLASIPLWAWIALGAGAFLLMSKKQGR
jgi:hypothetical protein